MSATIETDIELRPLLPSDVVAVLAITALSYRKEYHESEKAFLHLISAFPDGNFLALVNGEPVAYCFSHPTIRGNVQELNDSKLSVSGEENCYYIHDMCVHPAHQRRGITRLLFRKVLSVAQECGFDAITLVAVQKSRKFWEAKGFSSKKKILYGGLTAHYMECPLECIAGGFALHG